MNHFEWPSELKTDQTEKVTFIHLNEGKPQKLKKQSYELIIHLITFALGAYGIFYTFQHPDTELYLPIWSFAFILGSFVNTYLHFNDLGRKTIETIEVNQVILNLHLDNKKVIKRLVSDIKQFYVRPNSDLQMIIQNAENEEHVCFIHGLAKEKALVLAEALESYLDIFDIAIQNEARK